MARPSSYTETTIDQVKDYLELCENESRLPTVEGLALHLDVTRKTVQNWANDPEKPEFLRIFDRVKAEQAEKLLQKGLTGDYNASMAKMILSHHGYIEKSQVSQEISGKDGGPIEWTVQPVSSLYDLEKDAED